MTKKGGGRLLWFYSGVYYYVCVYYGDLDGKLRSHLEVGCGKTQSTALQDLNRLVAI